MRRRLDTEIVRRGLAPELDSAREMISAGRILVAGAPATNPARQVDSSEAISFGRRTTRFVGRGGDKLAGALVELGVDVTGHRVLDAGASTGGFTDVVLRNGAASVVAVDVGRGQLHESLRRDPRVTVRDRTNIRLVGADELGRFDTVVADLSFISLTAVLGNLVDCTVPGGRLVLLVKPQFEADRSAAGHNGGVISDPQQWRAAVARVVDAGSAAGAWTTGVCVSPLRGADGNTEFFVALTRPGHNGSCTWPGSSAPTGAAVSALIDDAIARAVARAPEVER